MIPAISNNNSYSVRNNITKQNIQNFGAATLKTRKIPTVLVPANINTTVKVTHRNELAKIKALTEAALKGEFKFSFKKGISYGFKSTDGKPLSLKMELGQQMMPEKFVLSDKAAGEKLTVTIDEPKSYCGRGKLEENHIVRKGITRELTPQRKALIKMYEAFMGLVPAKKDERKAMADFVKSVINGNFKLVNNVKINGTRQYEFEDRNNKSFKMFIEMNKSRKAPLTEVVVLNKTTGEGLYFKMPKNGKREISYDRRGNSNPTEDIFGRIYSIPDNVDDLVRVLTKKFISKKDK